MSQERLEEILKESPFNQHTEEFLIKLEDMNEITKIVQELENENRILRTVAESNKYIGEQYLEQNQRYREALEEIAQKRMAYADMAGVLRIAREALEGRIND